MAMTDAVLTRDELLENEIIAANWEAIVAFVADWIAERPRLLPLCPETLAEAWREEMT